MIRRAAKHFSVLIAIGLTAAGSRPAATKDLTLARGYHAILNVCLDRMLADRRQLVSLANMNRSLMTHCDCVATAMIGNLSPAEWPSILNGELPDTAQTAWFKYHDVCANIGR